MTDDNGGVGKGRRKLERSREEIRYALLSKTVNAGEDVRDAAKAEGVSESLAYKLLREAKENNLIIPATVTATRPAHDDLRSAISTCLHKNYGIRHVEVLASLGDDSSYLGSNAYWSSLRRSLGALAAARLESRLADKKLPNHVTVALSGGRAAMNFADFLFGGAATTRRKEDSARESSSVRETIFRPLTLVGRWRALSHADASGVLQRIYHRFGYQGAEAPSGRVSVVAPEAPPAVIHEIRMDRNAWKKYPEIDAVFGPNAERPHFVVSGIGYRWFVPSPSDSGPHGETSRFVQRLAEGSFYLERKSNPRQWILRRLPDRTYRRANHELFEAGAVAEVFRNAVTSDGKMVPERRLDQSPLGLGVSLEEAKKWVTSGTESIAMVATSRMVHALRAALRTGCFTTCILDTALAVQVLLAETDSAPPPFDEVKRVREPREVEIPTGRF